MSSNKTYHWILCLPPTFPITRTGVVQLDALFPAERGERWRLRLDVPFNDQEIPTLPEGSCEIGYLPELQYRATDNRELLARLGVHLPPVYGNGGGANANALRPNRLYVDARDVGFTTFRPTAGFLDQALDSYIIRYMLTESDPHTLFIITGIVIASQATIGNSEGSEFQEKSEAVGTRFSLKSDFVLAYRCSRIVFDQARYYEGIRSWEAGMPRQRMSD